MAAFGYRAPIFSSAALFRPSQKPEYANRRVFLSAPVLQIQESNIKARKGGFQIAQASSTASSVAFKDVCFMLLFCFFFLLGYICVTNSAENAPYAQILRQFGAAHSPCGE